MKKICAILLCMVLLHAPLYGADQWAKIEPAGTQNMSDVDTLIQTNNEALDRLLFLEREDCTVSKASSATLSVALGTVAIPNAAGSIVRYRRNTAATTVTWSDIDTGSEANSTRYYVFAVADTDATTFTVKISTSDSTPTGLTYFRRLGSFYNDASGDIILVKNYNIRNGRQTITGWAVFDGTAVDGTADLTGVGDSYNVTSVVDNSTGNYTINWDTDFSSANYAVAIACQQIANAEYTTSITTISASSITFCVRRITGEQGDPEYVSIMAIGNQ